MANRLWNRFQALEKEVKSLYAEVAIGATGAPTLTSGLGVTSIARDSAGVYIITLDDKYTRLMAFNCMMYEATAEDITFQVEVAAVATTKTIQFQCKAGSTETECSDGSVLLIKIDLKNSNSGE